MTLSRLTAEQSKMYWGDGNPAIMNMHRDITVVISTGEHVEQAEAWCEDLEETVIRGYTTRRLMYDDDGDHYWDQFVDPLPTFYFQKPENAIMFKLMFANEVMDIFDPKLPIKN